MKVVDKFVKKIVDRALEVNNQNKKKKISSGKQIENSDLFRKTFTIADWSDAVDIAEDVDFPERIELARLYKNLIDDDSIFQTMQIRTSKSVKGSLKIVDKENNEIEGITDQFFKPDGNPLKWFRDWMKLQVDAKYYGAVLIAFGDIKDNKFESVKKVDYKNVVPEKNLIIRNTDYATYGNGANMIPFDRPPIADWCYLVHDGDPRSLGLLNKCAPYYIWKNDSLGNWSLFQELFGVDTKVGKTDTSDPERRKDMDAALANSEGAAYITIHTDDEVEFVASKVGDSYNTFKEPNLYYDKAINKIILGQTSLAEDKSFVGSAEIQEEAGQDVIMFDKFDISDNFEEQLIPFMQFHGMIPEGDYFLIWDMQEKVTMSEMAEIINKLAAHYDISEEEVSERFNIQMTKKETDKDIIETANNVYKHIVNG
jgi:hypothetical protein